MSKKDLFLISEVYSKTILNEQITDLQLRAQKYAQSNDGVEIVYGKMPDGIHKDKMYAVIHSASEVKEDDKKYVDHSYTLLVDGLDKPILSTTDKFDDYVKKLMELGKQQYPDLNTREIPKPKWH